jgi:YD repeat-containing protein
MRIDYDATQPAPDFIRAIRADGKMIPFLGPTLNAPQDPTVSERLEVLPSGFKLTTKDDEVELYALNGKLLSITNREGLTQTLTYDTSGNLTTVTDPFGRTLTFTYGGPQRWIQTVTTPDGVLQYAYVSQSGAESLGSVTYPDGRTRSYLYAPPAGFVPTSNLLSGIVDEKGVQYATFTYQGASGGDSLVTSTQHAGGVGRVEVSSNNIVFGARPVQVAEFISPGVSVTRTPTGTRAS